MSEEQATDEQIRAHVTYRVGEKLINLVNVSAQLGHSQVKNTLCYVHTLEPENIDNDADHLISRDAVEIIRAVLEDEDPFDILQRFPWINHGWRVG
jgi:hypothetical protein